MKHHSLAAAFSAALVLGTGAAWANDVPLNDPAKEAEIRTAMAERGFEEVRSVGTIDGKFEVYALMGGMAFEVFLDQSLCIVTMKMA
ncbi:MAG: PepSY domain-containing protein [Gemmobacter sp.]